ncbi:ribonucleotide reductase subunit alpha [Polaromonas sp. C04]|uniref:ribonucleotide reductase subunit alpha n=1 Tax=Polaromonas sp. C04 TaxID=1945857 RepID=UPI0009842A4F|nr:ribonucleotide reductase subunit alpha [Polaromonas sp. C04]OOG50414.1 ribonucleotide reductase subunit alpha [Polaromonas sp. C04]
MMISSFEDLLLATRQQVEPQRLLFVFSGADLPDDATPEQRSRFQSGMGGALTPLMCVDKAPEELGAFSALVEESREFGHEWAIVFVAALAGRGGVAPTSEDAQAPLQRMVESIKAGLLDSLIPFDRQGQPVILS